MPSQAASNAPARQVPLLGLTLGLWASGIQLNELLAAAGAWSTAAVVLAEALRHLSQSRRAIARAGALAWWPLLAFVGWALLVPVLLGALPTGSGAARVTDWLLLPVAARAVSLASLGQLRRAGLAAALTLLASCAAAGLQHFGYWPPLEHFDAWRWTKLSFHRVYEPIPHAEGRFMGGGLTFHRLRFANVSSVVVVMLLAHGLAKAGERRPGLERRLAVLAAAIGTVSVAAFPYARSATVALLAGITVVVALSFKHKLAAFGTAAAVVLAAVLLVVAVAPLRARFIAAGSAAGSGERPALVKAGLAAVGEHPLRGVGLGRFKPRDFAPADAPAQVLEHPGKAHNQLVSLAAEAGVPTALLFVALLGWLSLRLWRARPAGAGSLAALAVLAVLCLTHDPLFHAEMSLATVLALGAGLGQAGRFTADSRR